MVIVTGYVPGPNYNDYNNYGDGKAKGSNGQGGSPDSGALSGPSGASELPFPDASLSGTDWQALTNDLATSSNMMVSLSAIMTLLIQVMSQMRQNQREVALADAQNALQSGLNASAAMKTAAAWALGAGLISGTVNVAAGGMSAKQSASQLSQLKAAKSDVDAATKQLDQAKQAATKQSAKQPADGPDVAPPKPAEAQKPDSSSDSLQVNKPKQEGEAQADTEQKLNDSQRKDQIDKQQNDQEVVEKEVKKDDAAGGIGDKAQAEPPESEKLDDVTKYQQKLDAANKRFDSTHHTVQSEANLIRGKTEVLTGVSGLMGSFGNFFAESARAESKAYEAQAQYQQSMQQADQAFFQQLGDSIRAMMQSWQSADRATHEATQAIYNV